MPILGHSYFRTEKQKHFTDAMCQGTKGQKGRRRPSWTVVKNNSAKLTNRNKGGLTILEDTIISLNAKKQEILKGNVYLLPLELSNSYFPIMSMITQITD